MGSLIIQDLEASESAEKENERREALETHATAEFPGIDVDEATAPPRKGFSFFQGLSFSTIMGGSFVASSGRTFTNCKRISYIPKPSHVQDQYEIAKPALRSQLPGMTNAHRYKRR